MYFGFNKVQTIMVLRMGWQGETGLGRDTRMPGE